MFSFYKKLSALRKDPAYSDALVYGEFIPYLETMHNVMAYFRKNKEQTILVIAGIVAGVAAAVTALCLILKKKD